MSVASAPAPVYTPLAGLAHRAGIDRSDQAERWLREHDPFYFQRPKRRRVSAWKGEAA